MPTSPCTHCCNTIYTAGKRNVNFCTKQSWLRWVKKYCAWKWPFLHFQGTSRNTSFPFLQRQIFPAPVTFTPCSQPELFCTSSPLSGSLLWFAPLPNIWAMAMGTEEKKKYHLTWMPPLTEKRTGQTSVCTPAFTDTPPTLLCNEEQFQVQRRNFQPTLRHVGSCQSAVQWHQRLGPKTNRGCASLSLWSVLSLWRSATGQNEGWRAPLHKADGHCCTYVAVNGTRASRPKSTTSSWVAFQ